MSSILSVSQINRYLSLKIKNDPKLKGIAISGEISGFVCNSKSGHAYFYLKDEAAVIKAVMFASSVEKLKFVPQNGEKVIVFGNIDVYERDGNYQIIAYDMLPSGTGLQAIKMQELKEELLKLGVFDKPKKPICPFPNEIAVISSPDGAALWDIVSVVKRRYPIAKISVYPASVQGAYAPNELAKAVKCADLSGADTLILARGGGSKEDLSAFNSKEVVMAVYSCVTPIISAVGHEVDVSFTDAVADLRAPTPTGAAELATPDIAELSKLIYELDNSLKSCAASKLNYEAIRLAGFCSLLELSSPKNKFVRISEKLSQLESNIKNSVRLRLTHTQSQLDYYNSLLFGLNPDNILKRGYAIVTKDGKIIADSNTIQTGDTVTIKLNGVTATAVITTITKDDSNEL